MTQKKAIVLLSGGLDSTTTLAIVKSQNYIPYCLSFQYAQRHSVELDFAKKIAKRENCVHKIINIDLRAFGKSALTDEIEVPKGIPIEKIGLEIPITYVPARNTIFLSYALAYAEVIDASNIFIGANIIDYSGYPDCRPEFINAFENMANLATKKAVQGEKMTIHTPLIKMDKLSIIKKGMELGVNYANTLSCYDPDDNGHACGKCEACTLRLDAFERLNMKDPAKYI